MRRRDTIQLRTTVLTLDPAAIDWARVAAQGTFTTYDIPWAEQRRWDHLHTWYRATSTNPYFLNTAARRLTVLTPAHAPPAELRYEGQLWRGTPLDLRHPRNYHTIVKVLLSAFLHARQIFAANGDFYLLVRTTPQGYAKALKVRLAQQWRDSAPYDLALIDEGRTLRPVRVRAEMALPQALYGEDSREGLAVLRRVHPEHARRHDAGPLYTPLTGSPYRTTIPTLGLRSLTALRESRQAVLGELLGDLLPFFGSAGLPFELRTLEAEPVQRRRVAEMTSAQIPMQGRRIAVLDDRIRPRIAPHLEPPGFPEALLAQLQQAAQAQGLAVTLSLANADALSMADLVLRVQDNEAQDFLSPEGDDDANEASAALPPLLAGYDDPYQTYAALYGDLTSQSLNVNRTRKADAEAAAEASDQRTSAAPLTLEQYLRYPLPKPQALEAVVTNSLYQLLLKDVVRRPEDALARLPALRDLGETIFLHDEGMVYLDTTSLRFGSVVNSEDAAQLIRARTGWELDEDIIGPAYDRRYASADEEDAERVERILRDSYFMVSRDAVWQIDASEGRILYDTRAIRTRLRAQESSFSTEQIMPRFTADELAIFSQEQLATLARYLREEGGPTTSYRALTAAGKVLYGQLGIPNAKKLQDYLRVKDILIQSPKGSDVIPGYTGIWYGRATQQYYVGDKYGIQDGMERGFVLRRIVQHRPAPIPVTDAAQQDRLFEHLQLAFFPLLEVNFIRYHQYTVVPFPFRLISMWQTEQARLRGTTRL